MITRGGVAAATLLVLTLGLSGAARADESYELDVRFDALYDEQGQVRELLPQDVKAHPKAFWDQMLVRLRAARIEPQQLDGKPATFRSGMLVMLAVEKKGDGSGGVSIKGRRFLPLPVERYYPGYPKDVGRTSGWEGAVKVKCTVSTAGRCVEGSTQVDAVPGIPESVRRWGRVTLEAWLFKPQEIGGQPIEGEAAMSVRLKTSDTQPPRSFEGKRIPGR